MHRAGVPAAGVDHEIGRDSFAAFDHEPGHPPLVGERLAYQRAVARRDVRERVDPLPEAVLEQGTRHEVDRSRGPRLRLVRGQLIGFPLGPVDEEVLTGDARDGTGVLEVVGETGEELAGDGEAAGKKRMEVLALRNAATRVR